jgi:hypothetical protein
MNKEFELMKKPLEIVLKNPRKVTHTIKMTTSKDVLVVHAHSRV